jgi:nitrite reductase (NADH) small subunit
MENFVRVAATSELQPGQCKVVEAEGRPIALCNAGGEYYAIDNMCVHRGGPLGEGMLEGRTLTCPWHAWSYDVATGVNTINPNICLKTYPVKVEGSDIHIAV